MQEGASALVLVERTSGFNSSTMIFPSKSQILMEAPKEGERERDEEIDQGENKEGTLTESEDSDGTMFSSTSMTRVRVSERECVYMLFFHQF